MPVYDTGLSNLSYTAKDFNSIYNELLDLCDKISPKWKPSQSNESDPGVLLLKLDAIIGDKNNYNIDKNILELFPSSVTQYPAAREIFEQCGYIMPYYRGAEVTVSLNLDHEPEGAYEEENTDESSSKYKENIRLYTLPDFTMITDSDNSVVYTLVGTDQYLTSDGKTYEYPAIQGIAKTYQINNDSIVTNNSLDYNNRLYFRESNIAENGIFIQNIKNDMWLRNYTDWRKVDNVFTEPLNTPCYKFGVSKDGSKCYIEFPDDISNLIGEGIQITYLTTSGQNGNVSKDTLSAFFGDVESYITLARETEATPANRTVSTYDGEEPVKLAITHENVYIRNIKQSMGGKDPETIEEARKNYEKVKNTFNTLVSLRDYNNFLQTSNEVSNGFVCDRSNDIQYTTKIVTSDGELETIHNQVAMDAYNEYLMTPFDLKIYALKYIDPVTTDSQFDISFELAATAHVDNLKDDMDDIKCIQHDFLPLADMEIINIQLRYPIRAKIIPYNKLETLQRLEVQSKVATALYETLNSRKLVYGDAIDYDLVYDTIIKSDKRIKSLILDDFTYTAYVVYTEGGKEKSIELTATDAEKFQNTIKAKAILSGVTPFLDRIDEEFNFALAHTNGKIVSDAGKVTTNTVLNITLDDEGQGSIELKPNESIYLTAPNFITKETYANYVKYFYNLGSQINSNGVHELVSEEYIVFFWKDSDEDEHYKYAKYAANSTAESESFNIICPSFSLKNGNTLGLFGSTYAQNTFTYKAYEAAQSKIAELPVGTGILSPNFIVITYSTTAETDKTESYTLSQLIAQCDKGTILSGTKTIQIKDKNSIDLKKGTKVYWILNNKDFNNSTSADTYTLFKDSTTYTLKTGEYLFYSDAQGSTFSMLGPGTKLEYEGAGPLSVTAKTYEEVMYGANNLLNDENLWKILSDTLTGTEMMFYNIGAESTITFTDLDKLTESITINNNNITRFLKTNSDTTSLDEDTFDKLENFLITYKYQGVTTELPQISVSEAAWSGHSILNLNCGPELEQTLVTEGPADLTKARTREQSIQITDKLTVDDKGNYKFEELTSDATRTLRDCTIQTKYPVKMLGGSFIDITAFDMTGARYNNAFYNYTKPVPEESTTSPLELEGFNTWVSLSSGTNLTKTLNVDLPTVTSTDSTAFLLPFITYKEYTNFEITQGSTNLPSISGDNLEDAGLHFIKLNNSGDISISYTTTDNSDSRVQFLPVIAFNDEDDPFDTNTSTDTETNTETNASTVNNNSVYSIIKNLDKEHKFNYSHVVDNSVYIEDPLDPNSFLDPNHPYNKCTICRWNFKDSKIDVTSKIK